MGGRGIGRAGAVSVVILAGLCLSAGDAAAGQFEVATCQGAPDYSTAAFQAGATARMKVVRACDPNLPQPHGLITGNLKRAGKSLAHGDVAAVVLAAPTGTVITEATWEGFMKVADCRIALEVFAEVPKSPAYPKGLATIARGKCAERPGRTRTTYFAASFKKVKPLPGASRIIQRAICKAGPGRHCSASKSNYIRTSLASVTIVDNTPPVGAILPDTPLARGEWVSGDQPLNYSADDSVGVRMAQAFVGDYPVGQHARECAFAEAKNEAQRRYTLQVPCQNGTGSMTVHTTRIPDGTQTLKLKPIDSAGNDFGPMSSIAAKVDNTPPARVDVAAEGGEGWRNRNEFAAVWANPPESDRAPIAAALYKLCPAAGGSCPPPSEQPGDGISRLAVQAPGPGEWTLSLWRRDAARNANEGYASAPVTLRFDPDPPQLAFEPPAASDPTRLAVPVTDALSGLADGSIEIAREGSGLWQALVTEREGDRLVARIDDAAMPAGTYLMRAHATDHAGNQASTDRRVDGQPMIVTLPLRVAARMEASIAVERGRRHPVTELRPAVRMRFGRPVRVVGRLAGPDGSGIGGEEVQVLARSDAAPEHPIDVLRTGPDGRFEYPTTADSSHTLRFLHAATPTVLPASAEVAIAVPAATTARVRPRNVRNGRSVTFSGRLRGLPPPPSGKLVELQVRFPTGWQTFKTIRTGADGRWAARYRFSRTRGVVRYRFRARLPREAGYPFETGVSDSVSVRVRGHR